MSKKNTITSQSTKPAEEATPKSSKSRLNFTKKKLLIAISIIIAIILIDTFITGIGKFAYATVRCGKEPVSVQPGSAFAGGSGTRYYDVPGSDAYKINASRIYYCTPAEAEAEGIEPDGLTKEGLQRQQELQQQGSWPPRKQ